MEEMVEVEKRVQDFQDVGSAWCGIDECYDLDNEHADLVDIIGHRLFIGWVVWWFIMGMLTVTGGPIVHSLTGWMPPGGSGFVMIMVGGILLQGYVVMFRWGPSVLGVHWDEGLDFHRTRWLVGLVPFLMDQDVCGINACRRRHWPWSKGWETISVNDVPSTHHCGPCSMAMGLGMNLQKMVVDGGE